MVNSKLMGTKELGRAIPVELTAQERKKLAKKHDYLLCNDYALCNEGKKQGQLTGTAAYANQIGAPLEEHNSERFNDNTNTFSINI